MTHRRSRLYSGSALKCSRMYSPCRRHWLQLMPFLPYSLSQLFIFLPSSAQALSNFGCDGLVRPAPHLLSEMILSQSGAWIGSRSPPLRSAELCQTRFTTRQGRKPSSVTVLGVPEQSAGLLFKGGASGDVGSFSAPVGMFVARNSQGTIRRSRSMSKRDAVIAVLPVRRR